MTEGVIPKIISNPQDANRRKLAVELDSLMFTTDRTEVEETRLTFLVGILFRNSTLSELVTFIDVFLVWNPDKYDMSIFEFTESFVIIYDFIKADNSAYFHSFYFKGKNHLLNLLKGKLWS